MLFLYFSVWAVVKAPFQSPDEFAHYLKALSIGHAPWVPTDTFARIPAAFENPLSFESKLHSIPFHRKQKVTKEDLIRFKSLSWTEAESNKEVLRKTSALLYPPFFYVPLWALGEGATRTFRLSPYSSHFAYRLSVCFMVTLLWGLVWHILGKTSLNTCRTELVICVVLTPMVGFLSSSINPDAIFIPLAGIGLVAASETLAGRNLRHIALFSLTAACLVKQAGWIVAMTIGAAGSAQVIINKLRGRPVASSVFSAAVLAIVPLFFSWILYYAWLPAGDAPSSVSPVSPLALWESIYERLWGFWEQSIGLLGWTDYKTRESYYRLVLWTWVANAICMAWYSARGRVKFPWRLQALFILHTIFMFVIEFVLVASNPTFILQGRYLLPAALCFFAIIAHPIYPLRWLMILSLMVINASLLSRSIDRYYAPPLRGSVTILPFTPPPPNGVADESQKGAPMMSIDKSTSNHAAGAEKPGKGTGAGLRAGPQIPQNTANSSLLPFENRGASLHE